MTEVDYNSYQLPYGYGQQHSDRADILDKINPEKVIEVIRNALMGKEFIEGVWVEVEALKERRISEIGAWELSNLLKGVSHLGVSISKFKDHEIKKRAFRIASTAQLMMVQNWILYDLKNTAQQFFVNEIIFTTALAILKQADDASIQDLLGKVVKEKRDYDYDTKEGITDKIKRSVGL